MKSVDFVKYFGTLFVWYLDHDLKTKPKCLKHSDLDQNSRHGLNTEH